MQFRTRNFKYLGHAHELAKPMCVLASDRVFKIHAEPDLFPDLFNTTVMLRGNRQRTDKDAI